LKNEKKASWKAYSKEWSNVGAFLLFCNLHDFLSGTFAVISYAFFGSVFKPG